MIAILYLLFFVSGTAALIYEVAWARSLSLVFGGSHLAVATVLSVFMGGLALGGALFGRRADRVQRPLRLYGAIEVAVAVSAAAFLALARVYPVVYVPLAGLVEGDRIGLTAIRIAFAILALIVPTTLMGGTLPVLARFAAARPELLRGRLALLYGINTLGAVAGALAVGFVLLETLGLTRTVLFAAALNLATGLVALALPERAFGVAPRPAYPPPQAEERATAPLLAHRLVLWGIGVSGFCALAYEVLWTRMLSMVFGTSVYSFTIMLVAFLSGIGLGSAAWGLWRRAEGFTDARRIGAFAAIQVAIGLSAFGATAMMRYLPDHAARIQAHFAGASGEFVARQNTTFALAFGYLFVPALLMGVAFPLAGTVRASRHRGVAAGVGEVLAFNTLGAITGSAVAGFALIQALGIERSLLVIAAINVGAGVVVAASLHGPRAALAAGLASGAITLAVAAGLDGGRLWNEKYLAIWRNNTREVFDTPERAQDALENTDVLYYFEGADETISVVEPRGGYRGFIVNGRSEASNAPGDMQCQRVLGHLPLLLHADPRNVFVLGAGSGMTLGAATIHPEVESIVLAEIEPGVLPATRAFGEYNHHALDNPKVRVVFDDGRNFLATTHERFDVITADPIHPWSGGAAYLYTTEYFRLAASRLRPGGIAAQWLPIYELTPGEVATVVRTFGTAFRYTLVWLTLWDTELVGSNEPIVLDERELAARIGRSEIATDLAAMDMGTADDFLSYFLMGTTGVRGLAALGEIHSDDNLGLEFSAPRSMGQGHLLGENAAVLARFRESLVPYLAPRAEPEIDRERRLHWERRHRIGALYDRAHALFLLGQEGEGDLPAAVSAVAAEAADHAPLRFLERAIAARASSVPRLADFADFALRGADGTVRTVRLSAVVMHVGPSRGAMVVVDNDAREIYAQVYLDRAPEVLEDELRTCAQDVLQALRRDFAEPRAGRVAAEVAIREAALRRVAQCGGG